MIEIQGVDQLVNLSKALKAAGLKDLQKELNKSITTAMKPVMLEARRSARRTLPTSRRVGSTGRQDTDADCPQDWFPHSWRPVASQVLVSSWASWMRAVTGTQCLVTVQLGFCSMSPLVGGPNRPKPPPPVCVVSYLRRWSGLLTRLNVPYEHPQL